MGLIRGSSSSSSGHHTYLRSKQTSSVIWKNQTCDLLGVPASGVFGPGPQYTPDLDEESLPKTIHGVTIMSQMEPRWIPGTHDSFIVVVFYVIATLIIIMFNLNLLRYSFHPREKKTTTVASGSKNSGLEA